MKTDNDLINYINSQKLMSLATYSKKIWTATVYYAVDEKLNLYFLSDSETEHCKSIEINSEVACGIYDSTQDYSQTKIGLQIRGKVEKLKGLEALKAGAKLLINIIPAFTKYIDPNDVNKLKTAGIYKITPELIKFFNKDLFPKEGFKIY